LSFFIKNLKKERENREIEQYIAKKKSGTQEKERYGRKKEG
jgi:hypothetical protein